jgi:hypothetical protein
LPTGAYLQSFVFETPEVLMIDFILIDFIFSFGLSIIARLLDRLLVHLGAARLSVHAPAPPSAPGAASQAKSSNRRPDGDDGIKLAFSSV